MIISHNSEKEQPTDRLKTAIVGRYKVGKSWLCATARRPILFIDHDLRAEALAGKPGVFVKSFKDGAWFMQPTAFQETIDVITKLEDSLCLAPLFPEANLPADLRVATLVFDSGQSLSASAMRQGLFGSKEIRRSIVFGSYTAHIPKSFDGWQSEMKAVEDLVIRVMGLPVDFLITMHETAEEATDSTEETPKYTGRTGVYPPRLKNLLKNFNEVWRVDLAPAMPADPKNPGLYLPRVQCRPDYKFDACTAMKLDQFEEPNIEKMIAKHLERSKYEQG